MMVRDELDSLGSRVAALRKRKGLTQQQLAGRIRISRVHLSRIETNDSRPSFEVLGELVRILGPGVMGFGDQKSTLTPGVGTSIDERFILSFIDVFDFQAGLVEVQLHAEIAAGEPMYYVSDGETVMVPTDRAPKGESEKLVRVRGDSMVEEGIEDGDYLIVEMREGGVAATNELIVAWYNGGCTVKRWIRRDGRKVLQAGNPDAPSYEIGPDDEFRLIGIVRGWFRFKAFPKIGADTTEA